MNPKNEPEKKVRQGGTSAALGVFFVSLVLVSLVLALAVTGIVHLLG